jgi:hypothetical protein
LKCPYQRHSVGKLRPSQGASKSRVVNFRPHGFLVQPIQESALRNMGRGEMVQTLPGRLRRSRAFVLSIDRMG